MLVMNSLVDQLEGTMTCDSTKGTRFTINFKSN
jgi:two-component sensor histidine kinase